MRQETKGLSNFIITNVVQSTSCPQRHGGHFRLLEHFLVVVTCRAEMLPWKARLYFWGIHGIFAEIVFTGVWEFAVTGKLSLMGVSSLWSFFTYGLGTFLVAEPLHEILLSLKFNILTRCSVYVVVTFIWEFTIGAILSYFGACPWDYTNFDYDVMGLITMEYAPAWFFAGLYFEMIYSYMKSIEKVPSWKKYSSGDCLPSDNIILQLLQSFRSTQDSPLSSGTSATNGEDIHTTPVREHVK